MEPLSFPCDLGEKLIVILEKLKKSNLKIADEVFLQKLLTSIKNELVVNRREIRKLDELIKCLNSVASYWIENPPSTCILAFALELMGTMSGDEETFNCIQKTQLLVHHMHCLKMQIFKCNSLKLTYIKLMSNVVSHESGCLWTARSRLWTEIVDMYLSNSGLFIEREALSFLTKFLENTNWDNVLMEETLRALMAPLEHYMEEFEAERMTDKNIEMYEKKLEVKAIPVLQAFTAILESRITASGAELDVSLFQSHKIRSFWNFLLENCNRENLLEKVSVAYVLELICAAHDSESLTEIREVPDCVLEVFKILVKRKRISVVIKLAKYCQLFWNKMTVNASKVECSELESHFIIIQLVPALLVIRKSKEGNSFVDIFLNKIFDLTTENTERLTYLIRDVIKSGENEKSMDYAFQSVLSVSKNIETLNLKRAVLVFQALANVLKVFIPRGCAFDRPIPDEQFEREQMLCSTKATFLSTVLNAICVFIEKFKINWTEALESLCLLKFSATLLSNPNLPPRLGVQTLSLIKLAISNFMSPNLVLLLNKVEDTSIECLLPLLYNKLHDPNWEIRDSCVEVVGIIAELAETKYPVFREILIERNYCDLIVCMIDGDSESYVRSSALRALAQMMKIDGLRNRCLSRVDIISKITEILRHESEGIVRREAALLAKEVFECQNCSSESLASLFSIMGYAAVCDLHWEVKVNSLFFWEKVIQRLIADQGMIDGFFPSITFSKENKKIVSLTNAEIKSRLSKVLNELSNIGCLHVLVTTLKNDCDLQVVQKSAQILTDLTDVLKRYDVLESPEIGASQCEKQSVKRKSSDEGLPEKKVNYAVDGASESEASADAKSARVIEDIVNELDLSLLGNVYNPREVIRSPDIDGFSLTKIKPQLFLHEMQSFNISGFLSAKRKWFLDREDDLNELLNDVLTLSVEPETNILDCY